MMYIKGTKRACATFLVGALAIVTAFAGTSYEAAAAKKTSLKPKKISIEVGQTKKITIQGKQAKHKYTFTSKNKKVAKVSAKGVVTGVKSGTTKITVKDSYTKNKKKKVTTVGTVTVKVSDKTVTQPTQAPAGSPTAAQATQTAAVTAAPTGASQATQTPVATAEPTAEPTDAPIANLWPDEVFDPENTSLPNTENGYFRENKELKYAEIQEIQYYSSTTKKDRKANVLLPVDYSEEKQYPVMYLLHGLDGDHNEWKNSGRPSYIMGNLYAAEQAKEMIIVMPNARARANDAGGPSDSHSLEHFQAFDNFKNDLINDLMPYIKENYSIAEGRENTAIAGLSMGGRTALYIGISTPEMFGYVGAFSPAPGVLPYSNEGGLFKTEEFKLPDEYNGKNFVMICTANDDNVVYDNPLQYAQTLQENGTKCFFFMRNGGGHGWDVWKCGLYHFAKRIFTQN